MRTCPSALLSGASDPQRARAPPCSAGHSARRKPGPQIQQAATVQGARHSWQLEQLSHGW
jgi:hypothetical protein